MWCGLSMPEEPIAENITLSQRVTQVGHAVWLRAIDWLTPPKCLVCRDDVSAGATVCVACWQKLHFIDEPVCESLGTPFEFDAGEGALSAAAIADPPPWDRGRAAVAFDDASKALVHLLKYRDTQEAGLAMAGMMMGPGRKLLADCDVIVPVPLHRFRLWQRRFNQAAFLARQLARRCNKPCATTVLVRRMPTRAQVGLTAAERMKNVRGAFAVPAEQKALIEGRKVLLVDDVRTTGATAAACATTLKAAGAAQVDVLCFALVLEPARLHIDA
jgi:ComF family protein